MESLLTRGLRGIGANAIGHVISLGNAVVLVPFFLASWGGQRYGEWLALSAAIGYLTLLGLGIQTYVVNRMNQAYAQGRLPDLHRDLHSSLRIFAGIGAIGLAALLAFVGWVPLDRMLNFKETSGGTAALTFLLLGLNVLLNSIPMGVIGGLYWATGAYPRGQMIGNGLRLAQFAVSAIVVWLGLSMAALAVSWVLVNVAGITLIITDLRRFRPDIDLSLQSGSIRHGLTLLGPALLFLLISLAATVNAQGTVLIVNWYLGGFAVVQFSTTRIMANLIPQSMSIVSSAFWPELTVIEARGEQARLARVSQSLVKLNVSFAVVSALLIHFIGRDLYQLWTGRQIPFASGLLDIMLIQVVLFAFWNTASLPLMASNHQRAYAWWMVTNAVMAIVFGVIFAKLWGTIGVALGVLLADGILGLLAVPRLVCRALDTTVSVFVCTSLLMPVGIGVGILIGLESVQQALTSPLWRFGAIPVAIVMLYGAASYCLFLDTEERNLVRGFPQRMRTALS